MTKSICGIACAAMMLASSAKAEPVEEIIVVFKQHYDLGFWGTCQEGFLRPVTARKMVETFRTFHIDTALDTCEKTRGNPPEQQFVWTVPGWPMAQMAAKDQDPVRLQRVREAIRRGQLSWLANPFTSHTEALELEELVRGMGFASRLSREFGLPLPRAANMTDVPEHSWVLATVLRNAGVDYFRIGCNPCSSWPDLPSLYWWEGPDGSRVLSMYTPVNYGTDLKPPADWPYKTWLWMHVPGDNCNSQTAADVQRVLDRAKAEMPGVKVRIGTLSDFFDAIKAEKPDLPVIRKDFGDTWIHGIMSMPQETGMARNLRPRIGALESLSTLLAAWNVKTPPARQMVQAAYDKSILFGEHTWGSWLGYDAKDYLQGKDWENARAEGRYKDVEATYREHGDYIRDARALVEPAIAEQMQILAQAVKVSGKRIVVFNPLPWKRQDVIDLPAPNGLPAGRLALQDISSKRTVPAEYDGKTIRFLASDVPPMGYRTYKILSVKKATNAGPNELRADAVSGVLENRFFRVKLDVARGVVSSIIDKKTGRELVDGNSAHGLGQYLYERLSDDNVKSYLAKYGKLDPWVCCKSHLPPASRVPYAAGSPKDFTLTTVTDSVSATATMSAPAGAGTPHAVSLKVTLCRDTPAIDLEWSIKDKNPDPWPEAGWLCLPLKISEPRFQLARLGSIVDPAKDIYPKSNHDVFCLNGGLTVQDRDGRGVGICATDSPLVSLGYPGLLQFNTEWSARKPEVFVNLFNNVWGCNFQQWFGGSWSSRVRVWSVQGENNEANLITPSWEARSRCLASVADGPAGILPPEQSGVEISRKGVLVTAFGDDPDGNPGTLLRIWEHSGVAGEIRIKLPLGCKFTKALPVTLRGEPKGAAIAIKNNEVRYILGAYAPCSFILTR